MVEFQLKDYKVLLHWFELSFAKMNPDLIPLQDKKTFWKLSFLCEDKIIEEKDRHPVEEE